MKVLILTMGSRGDVQPYVALGRGLVAAGHEVTVGTGELFREFVESHGLGFAPINDEIIRLVETDEGKAILEGKGDLFAAIGSVEPMIRQQLLDGWQAAQTVEPDLIVYHPKSMSGYHVAERLNVPSILSLLLPTHTPTTEFPIPLISSDLGGFLNKLSFGASSWGTAPYSSTINTFRTEELGLDKVGISLNETLLPDGSPRPTMYGYSSHVLPRPADWPDSTIAAGYWFLDTDDDWTTPEDLAGFLEAGPPPVYVGFGSMAGTEPERLADAAIGALDATGQRGILATGWGGLAADDVPDSVLVIKGAPHDWLFPHTAAVVHHGGAGTTGAGLRAGRPTLICPFTADQPFWGEVVYQIGAGAKPIGQKNLTAESLAAGIEALLERPSIAHTASEIGRNLSTEDGIGNGVQFAEQVASTP